MGLATARTFACEGLPTRVISAPTGRNLTKRVAVGDE
jgi:hypothetical protein